MNSHYTPTKVYQISIKSFKWETDKNITALAEVIIHLYIHSLIFYILVALYSHTHTSAQTVTSPKPDMCKSGAASALDETNQRLPPNSSSTNSEPQNRESVTTCLWRLLYIHDFTDAIMWNRQNRHSLLHSIGTFGGYRCLYCFIL